MEIILDRFNLQFKENIVDLKKKKVSPFKCYLIKQDKTEGKLLVDNFILSK